ncbi:uncharacterized protein LOC119568859 [Penaeus monodon]|uniref:uncharacterized protein LOC119568859 n=1 Tax=Penaeus monodon TaxID=6687 RepID=UPI0018A73FA4|nr:uncharacterized protein LOC119568859 [Penaeus monodon]
MVLKQTQRRFRPLQCRPPLMSPKKSFYLDSGPHPKLFLTLNKLCQSHPYLRAFDPALPTILQTDASRLYGLGYVLLQDHGAGRYKMVKCKFYLRGLQHFSFMTDYRPLVPILNHYSLDAIENPRLQRMKDKIAPYIFTAMWRADAIDEQEDLFMEELRMAASKDASYEELLHHVKSGFPNDRYNLPSTLCPYWKIRNELYKDGDLVLYGPRVVVPASLRRSTLARLHDCQSGVEATKRRAQQTVFWPGINADIVKLFVPVNPCQRLQPSQQQEPLLLEGQTHKGHSCLYQLTFSVLLENTFGVCDRVSGWPVVIPCGKKCNKCFND